jgi:hypothetical protein
MARNSGTVIQLADGRKCILYNKQPVPGKIVLHLTDDNFKMLTDERGRHRTLLRSVDPWVEEMKDAKTIGYID